jgi:uncharacterized YigZ family protein
MSDKLAYYHTLQDRSEGLFTDKGSKFICFAFPCVLESELKAEIERYRELHPKSRHVCHAWRSHPSVGISRSSDDGEPSGTAGKPMLQQLESKDLYETALVCIRYFGGIKLGTPGLIRAYKQAARDALDHGHILRKEICQHYRIHGAPESIQVLMSIAKALDMEIPGFDLQDWQWMDLKIPLDREIELVEKMRSRFEKNRYEPGNGDFVLLNCRVEKTDR